MGRRAGNDFEDTLKHTYMHRKGVSVAEVADGAVLLSLDKGVYYGLNPTALFIFQQFDGMKSCDAIIEMVLDVFDADRAAATADLTTLVHDLVANGLIAAVDADPESR